MTITEPIQAISVPESLTNYNNSKSDKFVYNMNSEHSIIRGAAFGNNIKRVQCTVGVKSVKTFNTKCFHYDIDSNNLK